MRYRFPGCSSLLCPLPHTKLQNCRNQYCTYHLVLVTPLLSVPFFPAFSLLCPSGVTGGLQGQALQAVGVHQGVLTVCKQKHGCLQSCKAQRREGGCPSTFFSSLSITTSQCNPRSQISKLKGKKKMLEK